MKRFIMLVIFGLFSWVIAQWWIAPRGVVLDAGSRNTFPCIEYDPIVFHRRKPNCNGWGVRGDRRIFHKYNSLGLRDKNYAANSSTGYKRILVLGASNLAGPGLADKNVAVRVWEKLARAEGKKIEFINGATDAYFTLHSRLKLSEYLKAYHPQIVVHYLAARNGIFTDAVLSTSLSVNSEGGKILARHPLDHYPLLSFFFQKSSPMSPDWLEQISIFEQIKRARISWLVNWGGVSDEAKIKYLLDPTINLLKEMQTEVEASGAKFYVLWNRSELVPDQHVPPGMSVERVKWWNQYLIHGFRFSSDQTTSYLRRSNLPLVEIWDPRLSYEQNRLPHDFHWNEAGAILFAKLANAALRDRF